MRLVQVDITIRKVGKNGKPVRILERVEAANLKPDVAAELLREIAADLTTKEAGKS